MVGILMIVAIFCILTATPDVKGIVVGITFSLFLFFWTIAHDCIEKKRDIEYLETTLPRGDFEYINYSEWETFYRDMPLPSKWIYNAHVALIHVLNYILEEL